MPVEEKNTPEDGNELNLMRALILNKVGFKVSRMIEFYHTTNAKIPQQVRAQLVAVLVAAKVR